MWRSRHFIGNFIEKLYILLILLTKTQGHLLCFWQLYLSVWYFFIYFHQNPGFYSLFRLFYGKMSFCTPKGERSSGRLSFLPKYFKKLPVHWVFLKNWAWVFLKLEFFSNLSFFGLSFFLNVQKKPGLAVSLLQDFHAGGIVWDVSLWDQPIWRRWLVVQWALWGGSQIYKLCDT